MQKTALFILVGAAAVLISGCYGHGPYMGWGDHGAQMNGSHMNGYRMDGYPSAPCERDGRSGQNGNPCRTNP